MVYRYSFKLDYNIILLIRGYPSDYQWIEGVPMRLEVESAVLVTLL